MMTRTRATTPDGVSYRDLNGNGRMDPYEDSRLSIDERLDDLIPRLSIEEKAGLLFHTMIDVGTPAAHDERGRMSPYTPRELFADRLISHVNVSQLPSAKAAAEWQNAVQELAEETPHGIPITFSTDPRHAFSESSGVSFAAGPMSQWPEPLGLAAIGDEQLVREYADVVRREYLAVGIRDALHPQLDLATEPRWGRQAQTFGQDAELAARLGAAFVEGLQGNTLGTDGIGCTTKHFPGGGPLKNGEDSHFNYGREQVYPGGRFEEHLKPFLAAIEAGTSAIMSAYAMPVGLELDGEPVEQVAFGFNRQILTGLLREKLGYDGVILTDWGLVTDSDLMGLPFPARAWGVEHLSEIDRVAKILDAGADQLGGEVRTDLILELVATGRVTEARIDESVRRILKVKFELGLFDDPYVDADAADQLLGTDEARAAGRRAQSRAVTVLQNSHASAATLPLTQGRRVFAEGMSVEAAGRLGEVVQDPAQADVIVMRLRAPFEQRGQFFLELMFHQGSLDFPEETVARVHDLAQHAPVVLDVSLDRPAILTPLVDSAASITASFGASDDAVVDAWLGVVQPEGRLPFELPRSMDAVRASREDVPSDTVDPLFAAGHGLRLSAPTATATATATEGI